MEYSQPLSILISRGWKHYKQETIHYESAKNAYVSTHMFCTGKGVFKEIKNAPIAVWTFFGILPSSAGDKILKAHYKLIVVYGEGRLAHNAMCQWFQPWKKLE